MGGVLKQAGDTTCQHLIIPLFSGPYMYLNISVLSIFQCRASDERGNDNN